MKLVWHQKKKVDDISKRESEGEREMKRMERVKKIDSGGQQIGD